MYNVLMYSVLRCIDTPQHVMNVYVTIHWHSTARYEAVKYILA